MTFVCISCWNNFEVEREELLTKGEILQCPFCGLSQSISSQMEPITYSGDSKRVSDRRKTMVDSKEKKAVLSKQSETLQLTPIGNDIPSSPPSTPEEYFVRSPTEIVYIFKNLIHMQNWSQMIDTPSNYLVSADNIIWKDFGEFLEIYKRTSDVMMAYSRSKTIVDEGKKAPHLEVVPKPDENVPPPMEKEEKKEEIPKILEKFEERKTPPPRRTSDFTFKVSEIKEKKPRWVVYIAIGIGVGGIVLFILQGLGIIPSFKF